MKPAPFDYIAPRSVPEALQILTEAGGGATVLAGGQTLMPLLALRMSQPFIVVDINRIPALLGVSHSADTTRIGATTRQADALGDPELAVAQPVLVRALSHVGHHQTRNRGTIGGSIALGEPAAELPATAVALGAEFELDSLRGERRVRADEFYLGPYMTTIEPDELLTAIHFPRWPEDTVTVFREVARRPGDFALVGLVGALHVTDGRVARAGLAWFGMGPTPIKARQAEAALHGIALSEIDVEALAALAVADTEPFDDHHATAVYRRTVGHRVFAQALAEIVRGKAAGMSDHVIEVTVNGELHTATVESRISLCDFLRGDLGFTGVHAGCEHGVCGACTVIVEGRAVRSCLMLAVQSDGTTITTVEGLAEPDGTLHPVQQAMREAYGLQCGFCTPGVLMTLAALAQGEAKPSSETMIAALSGHLCRCTGYQGMRRAARILAGEAAAHGEHA